MTETTLTELREKIDQIDQKMHELLMQRGDVIASLIESKKQLVSKQSVPQSALRPDREASMIQALIKRHKGNLPIETVIQVWRDIISTFTYLQSPYQLHVENLNNPHIREIIRAMYGFVVPLANVKTPSAVIKAISENPQDLGFIKFSAKSNWWKLLENPSAPKIVAILPDFTQTLKKAEIAGWVVGSPNIPTQGLQTALYSITCSSISDDHLPKNAVFCIHNHSKSSILWKSPIDKNLENITTSLAKICSNVHSIKPVGFVQENYWC